MRKQLNRYWRVIATGISFTTFGIGGLVLRLLFFPLLTLCIPQQQKRIKYARRIIQLAFRLFIELMRRLGVLRYEVRGLSQLSNKGLLILANHPTLIDTVFLMAFVQQANCIVKTKLWDNPFTHGPVRAAGYIRNESGPNLIQDCIASLHQGNNLIIFPEGTRTPRHGTMTFKRGAANIAVHGLRDVTPVIIRCKPLTLCKGEKWWQVPPTIPHFSIEVQQDIKIQDFVSATVNKTLAVRRLTNYLQHYFLERSQHHAAT